MPVHPHAFLPIAAAQLQQWLGIGHPLRRHPFLGLSLSASELLHTPSRILASMTTALLLNWTLTLYDIWRASRWAPYPNIWFIPHRQLYLNNGQMSYIYHANQKSDMRIHIWYWTILLVGISIYINIYMCICSATTSQTGLLSFWASEGSKLTNTQRLFFCLQRRKKPSNPSPKWHTKVPKQNKYKT